MVGPVHRSDLCMQRDMLGIEAVDRAAPLDEEGVEDCSDFLDDVECLLEVLENKNRLCY